MVGSVLSLAGQLSSYYLYFDLLSHFRIQYIVLIFPALCVSLLLGKRLISIALFICLSIHCFEVLRSYLPKQTDGEPAGPVIRVMTNNLWAGNYSQAAQVHHIQSVNPDIIVFQEYTSHWEQALSKSLPDYLYQEALVFDNPFGIALYSKFPLIESDIRVFAYDQYPTVEGKVAIGDHELIVIGVHPPPPVTASRYVERNRQLTLLGTAARSINKPMLILGDLNTTQWSGHFRQLEENGNLTDVRRGFGILTTWPSSRWLLRIPIDHILVNDQIKTVQTKVGEFAGSDHRSLWADIQLF